MPTQNEIIRAAEAIKDLVPPEYGMTWDEAKGYAQSALKAAEAERARHMRANCTHPRMSGRGSLSSDGASHMFYSCPDCGEFRETKTGARPPQPFDINSLPQNTTRR